MYCMLVLTGVVWCSQVVQLLTQESAEDRRVARYRDKIRYMDRAPCEHMHVLHVMCMLWACHLHVAFLVSTWYM